MAYTTPRTWVTDEVVTAVILNAHVRDNLTWLYGMWTGSRSIDTYYAGSVVTSTAAAWADLGSYTVTVTPVGERVLLLFFGLCHTDNTASAVSYYRLYNSTTAAAVATIGNVTQNATDSYLMPYLVTGLTPATAYTFTVQAYITNGGTLSIYDSGSLMAMEI